MQRGSLWLVSFCLIIGCNAALLKPQPHQTFSINLCGKN